MVSIIRVFVAVLLSAVSIFPAIARDRKPNILLIITDDQGYGDVGYHGNSILKTPHLDQLAKESVRMKNFLVSPVCAPTRASLLTGRYNYRTRVTDTYIGRAMMDPDEVTLAEIAKSSGYKTGIFGKWHLGDNYPMRPGEQGFDESLVHRGGGLKQPGNRPEGDAYWDPVLEKNGKPVETKGYCTDLFADAAIDFIRRHHDEPFFTYLAFNAPHTPLDLPEDEVKPYRGINFTNATAFPQNLPAPAGKINPEVVARIYGMVSQVDRNIGNVLAELKRLKIDRDTIVIFLTDNGPEQPRYNAGLRGLKGSVYEGGIRVPFFLRWSGHLSARDVHKLAAHIDVVPTLIDLCGLKRPARVKFDGRSLRPLLEGHDGQWSDRTLFFQWHRGDVPQLYRAFTARGERFKLVQAKGVPEGAFTPPGTFELFDLEKDPFESRNIADENPTIVADLKAAYEDWFHDVGRTRGYAPPAIVLGGKENPSLLTRQDWRGPQTVNWTAQSMGHWPVEISQRDTYQVEAIFGPKESGTCYFELGNQKVQQILAVPGKPCVFPPVTLRRGAGDLRVWLELDGRKIGAQYVTVRRK